METAGDHALRYLAEIGDRSGGKGIDYDIVIGDRLRGGDQILVVGFFAVEVEGGDRIGGSGARLALHQGTELLSEAEHRLLKEIVGVIDRPPVFRVYRIHASGQGQERIDGVEEGG